MRVDCQSVDASIHLSLRIDKCFDRNPCLTDDCLFALSVINSLSDPAAHLPILLQGVLGSHVGRDQGGPYARHGRPLAPAFRLE